MAGWQPLRQVAHWWARILKTFECILKYPLPPVKKGSDFPWALLPSLLTLLLYGLTKPLPIPANVATVVSPRSTVKQLGLKIYRKSFSTQQITLMVHIASNQWLLLVARLSSHITSVCDRWELKNALVIISFHKSLLHFAPMLWGELPKLLVYSNDNRSNGPSFVINVSSPNNCAPYWSFVEGVYAIPAL